MSLLTLFKTKPCQLYYIICNFAFWLGLRPAREPPSVPRSPPRSPLKRGKVRVAEFCTQIAALRLPFGLPFGREHFVVYTDLEKLFYLLNLREIMLPGSREPPSVPPEEGEESP